jgi:uncharacterized protein (DUF427 family)
MDTRTEQRMKFIPSPKRVRILFNGQFIADTKKAMLLLETGHTPVYYFPRADVQQDCLEKTNHSTRCPFKGTAAYWNIKVAGKTAENAVWQYPDPISEAPALKDYMAFYWDKVDAWFEEDEEVFVHPRDPFKRVDTLASSRHIRVVLADQTVADTKRPVLLFETGLPTRYYIPKVDVRMDLLTFSDTLTRCPYKGEARYFSVSVADKVYKDIVWYYPYPVNEAAKITNYLCFFNEKIDAIYIDGELAEKPVTRWSK